MSDFEHEGLTHQELEELRRTVSALRGEIDKRFNRRPSLMRIADQLGRKLRASARDLDTNELYQAARRAMTPLLTFGMNDRSVEVDEFGLDPAYLENARVALDFLYDHWWRVEVSDSQFAVPPGRVLYVANRSGILPYDGLMLAQAIERVDPETARPRFLVADWLMTLPFSQPLLARIGGVRACPENAERLLRAGHRVIAFPEGQKGALKPFRDRYRLQRFARGGFVSLALRLRATIVPVAIVGAEETHPVLFRPGLPSRLLGVPIPVTPTFPILGPLGFIPLPSQWRIRFGEPVRYSAEERDLSDEPLFINRAADRIRSTIQDLLDEEVHRRKGVFSA